MFLSAIATLALVSQGAPVTFHEPAAPLSRLMPALAKACNLQLEVSQALKTDVVCIDVHDVTPKALLDNLAWACGARWLEGKDGVFTLIVSDTLRNQQAQDELARQARLIVANLMRPPDSEDSEGATRPATTEPDLQREVFSGELDATPILRAFDPFFLASIPERGKVVFSTHPTPLQRPFPFDPGPIIRKILADYNEAASKPARDADEPTGLTPITGEPSRIVLAVEKRFVGDNVQAIGHLRLLNSRGERLDPPNSGGGSSGGDLGYSGKGKPVTLPRETRLFEAFQGDRRREQMSLDAHFSMPDGYQPARMASAARAEALERFLNPERVDPLTYSGGVLRALASANELQLVACLPDSFGDFWSSEHDEDIKSRLAVNGSVDARLGGGWLKCRPRDPVESARRRLDRHRLAGLLKLLEERAWLGRSEVASLAMMGFESGDFPMLDSWCKIARPSLEFDFSDGHDWDAARLYFTLPEAQRDNIHGQTERQVLLAPEILAQMQRAVFGGEGPHQFTGLYLSERLGEDDGILEADATDALPGGLPSFAILKFDTASERVFQASPEIVRARARVIALEPLRQFELVQRIAFDLSQFSNKLGVPPPTLSLPKRIVSGTRTTISFELTLAPGIKLNGGFSYDEMDPNTAETLDKLRDELKPEIEEQVKAMQAQYREF
ncbi:MAG TPA: hypothetical protein VKT78_08275, partial [Fimbriimonadaceae bacterium]|nr:hypothetical protein [Fimbriimonadaceae bacterium]